MKKQIISLSILIASILILLAVSCKKDETNDTVSNNPPTCIIKSPTNGQEIGKGAIITISAEAEDSDGIITEVRFYIDGVGKGSANSFPYNYEWSTGNESIGNHTIKAASYDNDGANKSDEISVNIIQATCPTSFTDSRDGNVYSAVQIGSQCWMAENLAYLPTVSPSSQGLYTSPYYYVYGYQGSSVSAAKATSNYQTYGVLYNWTAAMAGEASSNSMPSGVQGICPTGWHLPSDEEWKILEGEVDSQYGYPDPEWDDHGWRGTDAGGNLKETDTTHWSSPNTGATNSSGFNALPAGGRYDGNGSFVDMGSYAIYWSSTENSSSYAWYRNLGYDGAGVGRYGSYKSNGFSCRCIKD